VTAVLSSHRRLVTGAALDDLGSWAAEVEAWPVGSHVWGNYRERTAYGEAPCRTENVSACHDGMKMLVDGPLRGLAAASLGTTVDVFKDKLNYKHPGGAGFSPHQDLTAYPGVRSVISVVLAIDPCTVASGCLYAARGAVELLPTDDRGVLTVEAARSLRWEPVELHAGDAACLGGLVPHFSPKNTTSRARRLLIASYAPRREGYGRERYYAARAETLGRLPAPSDRLRISTIDDFEGVGVETAVAASSARCTHR
jgi:Phytanoyl-CoA dioxygenase (PhyH)